MAKAYGIIYMATNKINGKSYIGQTVKSLNRRISKHIGNALNNRDAYYFHKAIRKYGKENFEWEIIAECNSLEELNKAEIEAIKKYSTFENGYNLNLGGGSNIGFRHTEETRKKISESLIGENHPGYGKHRSEETKKRIGDANRGEKCYNYGKHRSEGTKRKMSKAKKGKYIGSKNLRAKKYIVTTPEGEEIFVHGLKNFCRKHKKEKLNPSNLIKIAQGKRNHHKNYKCKYWKGETNE